MSFSFFFIYFLPLFVSFFFFCETIFIFFQAIIGEEGREAYNSLIERKHTLDIDTTVCLLRKQEPQFSLKSAKTLPRRSTHFKHDSDEFISTIPLRSIGNDNEMVIPPLQNAPRPTTLPTRGAANRLRKAELELSKDANSTTALNSRMGDNVSPCESPSYVTNTSSYKFPEKPSSPADSETAADHNALPVLPPKEGKKHIQANPKRHVRKYPLIIPANGVQRTLQRVINDEEKSPSLLKSPTAANSTSRNLPTVKPFNINNNNMAEYENTTKLQSSSSTPNSQDRTYQNIGTDDTASLQFESILEADFNKDQVLQSPDVTDGFYNFSIQKDHYHKSKEVDFDAQKLASGLYVNEDELRNLDIEKNIVKLNKQNPDNSLKKSNESLDVKSTTVTEENIKHTTMITSSSSSTKQIEITEESFDKSPALAATQPSNDKLLKSAGKLLKADNELAGNALFKKVRESVDKAMIKPPSKLAVDTGVINKRELNKTPAPPTEAEMFSAAVNRLNDSNSVSCEDLLEFADKKPKGHERGVDSDEVRIMMKVLGKDVSIKL